MHPRTPIALAAKVGELDRLIGAYVQLHLAEVGHESIKASQRKVLAQLGKGRTVSQTARFAGISRQAMRGLLDDLGEMGYVRVMHSARYTRRMVPRLTPKGQEWKQEVTAAVNELAGAWQQTLAHRDRCKEDRNREDRLRELVSDLDALVLVTRGQVKHFADSSP